MIRSPPPPPKKKYPPPPQKKIAPPPQKKIMAHDTTRSNEILIRPSVIRLLVEYPIRTYFLEPK